MKDSKNGNGSGWGTKEKVLTFFGCGLIAFVAVAVTIFDRPFHLEFVFAGLALCGVALSQWGDKK